MSIDIKADGEDRTLTLQANHVRLAYQASGEGSPVVLVHGGWGDHEGWGQLVPLLAHRHQVIIYDRRGYGASERPLGPRRIRDDDVEDLTGLIARVAQGPADLVGNSLGASIALRLAALHPELVRSVSAHEPPLFSLLDGAGHVPQFTHPHQLAELLEDFWATAGVEAGRPV